MSTIFSEKLNNIKLVITDVDGVLTDGSLFYSAEGVAMKKFNIKDGMGTLLLHEGGIPCGVLTSDPPDFIEARANRIKLDFLFSGVKNKLEKLQEICSEKNVAPENVAYIGDDVNDLEIIKAVGFSASPSDAIPSILDIVDYVCERRGGEGAFREFVDLILSAKLKIQ
jgi:YrbI family 3-deoxy-D-manno-octulosonate 8-phosphate phosphatase